MNNLKRAAVLSDLVLRYQELVLVYQARERDFAMYSHRISKVFKRLASRAHPDDAAFAGRCISPAVDISMATYAESQAEANAKLDEIGDLLEELAQLSEPPNEAQSMLGRFFHALSQSVPSIWRL